MKKAVLLLILILTNIAFSAVTYLHVTVAGADTKDGTTWAKAMGMAEFRDHVQDTVVADTIYFVKTGTYTLGEAHTCKDVGAATTPIKIIGVLDTTTHEGAAVVYADWAYTTNRPVIAMAANAFTSKAYYHYYNLQFTTTSANGIDATSAYNTFFNCKCTQTGESAPYAMKGGDYSFAIKCEVASSGYGLYLFQGIIGCYIHDCVTGVTMTSKYTTINSIIDTCSTVGIAVSSSSGVLICGNTIYGCATGISGSTSKSDCVINNIISQCTTDGAKWTTATTSNFWGYNHLNNADACDDYDGIADGLNDLKTDHSTAILKDGANADFSYTWASTGLNAGLVSDYGGYTSIGGYQRKTFAKSIFGE